MKPDWHPFSDQINLHAADRVSSGDAARQMTTARVLLDRLATQPGVILADEVGMGKTFVALAVAVSVAISSKRPVVIMVPPALKEKWPQDFDVFREHCWRGPELRCAPMGLAARDGTEFLRLLDDPPSRLAHLIFVTHGALHRGLTDPYVKLAIIQRAIHKRRLGASFRSRLPELAREILHGGKKLKEVEIAHLLQTDSSKWRDPHENDSRVPRDVRRALEDDRAEEIFEILWTLSRSRRGDRVQRAREAMTEHLRGTWKRILSNLSTRLPLLILDEAHHAKNSATRLAGLVSPEARDDTPSLNGLCERYLFLTATPFQLGHDELRGVISRFGGINWKSPRAPGSKDDFDAKVSDLHAVLDRAQRAAQDFESRWARLRREDLVVDGVIQSSPDTWWEGLTAGARAEGKGHGVAEAAKDLNVLLRQAETKLRPWVVRHLKPREFEGGGQRRHRLAGDAIQSHGEETSEPNGEPTGLGISNAAVLPFMLAARAATLTKSSSLFAEGLSSSYEAFRFTCANPHDALDEESENREGDLTSTRPEAWHLARITAALPKGDTARAQEHPKIRATVERAIELWRQREKVLIFCHFRQTGNVLREVLSNRLEGEIKSRISDEAHQRWAQLLDQPRSKARQMCEHEISTLLHSRPSLLPYAETLQDIVRRFLRTSAYMARYSTDSNSPNPGEAFFMPDASGQTLRTRISHWFDFLDGRCIQTERKATLEALKKISTGEHTTDEVSGSGTTQLSPLVRLVRGGVTDETRRRLAIAFNAPFFPEILIASSVMAEGVDLHRSCRHVIHHDLCWNPATLEQRTGRLDRIGGKHEQAVRPLRVWLPWLAGMQDEKQFRVVSLRERWFGIIMGEKSGPVVPGSNEAESLLLPETLASQLALRLEATP